MRKVFMRFESPIDELVLVAESGELVGLYMRIHKGEDPVRIGWKEDPSDPVLHRTASELREYFAGERRAFEVPYRLVGTEFQQRVWERLAAIPYGTTKSYRDIAYELGDPNATRAVGRANGANPISIIVPCHRVIAADGTLGGYGGGLDRKRQLLDLENRVAYGQMSLL